MECSYLNHFVSIFIFYISYNYQNTQYFISYELIASKRDEFNVIFWEKKRNYIIIAQARLKFANIFYSSPSNLEETNLQRK